MKKNRRNYYRILHVQQDAPVEIIKSSYRTLMQKLRCHPDLGGEEWNAALLNEALAVLCDERKRAAYDKANGFGAAVRQQGGGQASPHETEEEPALEQESGRGQTGRKGAAATPYDAPFLEQCFFCGTPGRGMPACIRCDSPLQPPPPMGTPVSRDKRTLERLAVEDSVQVFVRWPQARGYQGVIRNFTPRGMQIRLESSLEPNQIIKISSRLVASVSRVASCIENSQGGGYHIGLEFLSLCIHRPRGGFVSETA